MSNHPTDGPENATRKTEVNCLPLWKNLWTAWQPTVDLHTGAIYG
jgi:hypothetical protein